MVSATQAGFVALAAILTVFYSGKGVFVIRKLNELAYGKRGCVPIVHIGNVTLHYFAGRGRAEAIRLMLEETKTPYTEVSFTKDTWPEQKKQGIETGLYTFGQVPALETSTGIKLVQSLAIMHTVGRATGLDCNCEDLHTCEIIALGVEDVRGKMGKVMYNPDFSVADKLDYFQNILPIWLDYFEELAPSLASQERSFFASGHLTWVDFLVYDLLEANIEFSKIDVGEDVKFHVLAAYPKLSSFFTFFSRRPRIAKWRANPKRHPFKIPYMPSKAKKA